MLILLFLLLRIKLLILNKATQIKTKLEKKAKINNNKPTKTFNTLTTISENPKIQPINTITIPEEIPEEEEEDAMETEENLNNKTEIIMEEERVMDTIKEEEEEEEEEKEKIEEKRVIDTIKEEEEEEEKEEEKVEEKVEEKRVIDTIKEEEEEKEKEEAKESKIESNQNVASSNPVNPLITPNMNQLQQQQLQQKQLQLQLQQQFQQQLQQQQLQQHQHNNLINMLQQQTQQRRQLQQEQQQRQMEEQEKQIREEQKLVVPPIVPSTINPLLMNNSSNFDRSLNLNSIIILQTLGTGTFGRVHLVRSKDNGKYYAMKAIKKSCVVSNHQVEHTMNEKKILENVRHPFFVRLQNTFQDSSHIFFITDYVCGGELFTCLRRYQVSFNTNINNNMCNKYIIYEIIK